MNKLLGWMMTGGLLLGYASTSQAQITIQPGRGGSPSVTFGQPAYGPQYAPSYARPNYVQPGYAQPGYVQPYQPGYARPMQPGYAQPYPQGTYSSGYSRYYTPARPPTRSISYPNHPAIRCRIASNPDITATGTTRTHSRIPPRGPA